MFWRVLWIKSIDFQIISSFLMKYLDCNMTISTRYWMLMQVLNKLFCENSCRVKLRLDLVGSSFIKYMTFTGFLIIGDLKWILIAYFKICRFILRADVILTPVQIISVNLYYKIHCIYVFEEMVFSAHWFPHLLKPLSLSWRVSTVSADIL